MTSAEQYLVNKWEYSPEWIIHFPTAWMYAYLSIRSLHPLFFTNVSHDYRDSDINNSGKMEAYRHLHQENYPRTLLMQPADFDSLPTLDLPDFPLIAKPNIGKRGLSAALIKDADHLSTYVNNSSVDILLQEYIDYAHECGIFYIRYPDKPTGMITSIGLKTLKTITGDGTSTILKILEKQGLNRESGSALKHYNVEETILEKDEMLVIEPIGAHNRGTQVRSGDHLISDELRKTIEQALGNFELYYGRLDIKFKSWDALLQGDFKVIEINTITSEPLSIYDPSFGLLKKYKTIYRHLRHLQRISAILKKDGHQRMSLTAFQRYIKSYRAHLKKIST